MEKKIGRKFIISETIPGCQLLLTEFGTPCTIYSNLWQREFSFLKTFFLLFMTQMWVKKPRIKLENSRLKTYHQIVLEIWKKVAD